MKAIEIVALIKQNNPDILSKTPEARAAKIIAAAFAEIAKQVQANDQGALKIQALGSFTSKQIEREKEGVKLMVKKTAFRPAKNIKSAE
ncbi:MAG: hypothetical protein K9K84_03645 [Methylovulum sp.]|jgi:hypothetical protein|nr:hypothetical protein [Methylovulum sp.]